MKKKRKYWRPGMRNPLHPRVRTDRVYRKRPNVTEPPPGPRKRTWIRGTLAIRAGFVFVGGWPLAESFETFDGKRVRITLEVLP